MVVILRHIIGLFLATSVIIASEPCPADDHLDRAISDSILALYDLDPGRTEISVVRNRLDISRSEYDALEISALTTSEPKGTDRKSVV